MKTKHILASLPFIGIVLLHSCTPSRAEESKAIKEGKECIEISFNFHRGGIASSQYAIWIEDEKGKLVRTIYATSFTAKGGYGYRKDAIPTWVNKAKPQQMTSTQVDAVTGATPQNGNLVYRWDGRDDKGTRVPAGKYKFFIEGTLHWKSRILYSGDFVWDKNIQNSIPVKIEYFNRSSVNENMITGLKVCYVAE
jgi:hypothetical protein